MKTSYFVRLMAFFAIGLCLLDYSKALFANVLVMTHSYNKPEFIKWQCETLKKLLQDEYEFVVFNDSPNEELSNKTEAICQDLNISCVRVPQMIHTLPYLPRNAGVSGPSAECADTIQYMLDTMGFQHPGFVVLLDSDMFLIRKLHIETMMKDYHIAASPQSRSGSKGIITYFLPNLLIFNMKTLPDKETLNFNLGMLDGVATDCGGFTHFYIASHPNLKWQEINCFLGEYSDEHSSLEFNILKELKSHKKLFHLMSHKKFDYEFYLDLSFLHFRAGSNWYKMEKHRLNEKTLLIIEAIEELIQDPI